MAKTASSRPQHVFDYFRYAEEHDNKWLDWYRQWYDAKYEKNDMELCTKIEEKYPGPPRGFTEQVRYIVMCKREYNTSIP